MINVTRPWPHAPQLATGVLIRIGDYEISKMDDGTWWVQRTDGEGMQAPPDALAKLIDDWFREAF